MKTKELSFFPDYYMIRKELATIFTLMSRADAHIGGHRQMARDPARRYSNSEHDMKYPQRWQTILQRWDSRRWEHTGQNWLGNSGSVGDSAGWEWAGRGRFSLMSVFPYL